MGKPMVLFVKAQRKDAKGTGDLFGSSDTHPEIRVRKDGMVQRYNVAITNSDSNSRSVVDRKSQPGIDNQGRNLDAMRRHQELLRREHEEGAIRAHAMYEQTVKETPLPDWAEVDGVQVLRSGGHRYVAVPCNGKKTAASFDIIDLDKREHVLTLKRDEVRDWLWRSARADADSAAVQGAQAQTEDAQLAALLKLYAGDKDLSEAEILEAARQYREVEARYRGTPQWMKAPNGEPTKLNERQWVLVRTPNFLHWFGHWLYDQEKPVSVTKISRDPAAPTGNSAGQWRRYAKHVLRGREAVIEDNGVPVGFYTTGIEAAIKNRNQESRSLFASLPEVLRNAVYVGYTENAKLDAKPGVVGYEHYVATVELDGRVRAVSLTVDLVRGWTRGRGYYYHKVGVVEVGGAVGYSRGLEPPAPSSHILSVDRRSDAGKKEVTPVASKGSREGIGHPDGTGPAQSGVTVRLGDLIGVDKPLASKVVDSNGEPLVVYHGTMSDFPAFRNGPTYLTASPAYAERGDVDEHIMPLFAVIMQPATAWQWQEVSANAHGSSVAERREHAADHLHGNGFDGVDIGGQRNVWIALRPTQVKSAIGNAGTFRPDLGHLSKAFPPAKPDHAIHLPAYREAIRAKLADLSALQRQIEGQGKAISQAAAARLDVVLREIETERSKAYLDDDAASRYRALHVERARLHRLLSYFNPRPTY